MNICYRFKRFLFIFFIGSVAISTSLLASDILINTKPNPVQLGNKLRISLAAEIPVRKVTVAFDSGEKVSLSAVNETLFVGSYIIPLSTKPGIYNANISIKTVDGKLLSLSTVYRVISQKAVNSLDANIETSDQGRLEKSETVDLQLKIDQLESTMDQMEQDKKSLLDKINKLKSDINKMKRNEKNQEELDKKKEELKTLQTGLESKTNIIEFKMKDLKKRMKELNNKQASLRIKRAVLFRLEKKIRQREGTVRKKEFDLQSKEAQIGVEFSKIGQRQAELLSEEEKLYALESEIELKNKELLDRQENLDEKQSRLARDKLDLDTQRTGVDAREQHLIEVSKDILVKRKELVNMSLNLSNKQSEFNKLHLSSEKKNKEDMAKLALKESELEQMKVLLNDSKDALIRLEKDQRRQQSKLLRRKNVLEKNEKLVQKEQNKLDFEKKALSELEQDIVYKYELLKLLNYWVQNQIVVLREEHQKKSERQDEYLSKFDNRFDRLEKLSHLLEKRAYRLNQLNHKLSKENYILSQKLNESRQPNFRYFISPYLGFKLSKDDSVYSGGKEFGLCFGSRVGKQVNLQAGLGYLTYHSVQGSDSEIQQNVRYQLGGTYDLNPGEFARVFLSTGIDGNFGSSNFDMIGYGGLGLTLDTSDHFSTRMGIRYGNDILLTLGIQKFILPIDKKHRIINKETVVKKADRTKKLSLVQSLDVELLFESPEKQEFYFPQENVFLDIAGHWAEFDIHRMTDLHFIDGVGTKGKGYRFFPNDAITESDALKALVLAYYSRDFLSQGRVSFSYSLLGRPGEVYFSTILVKDKKGNMVKTLSDTIKVMPGENVVYWDGKDDNGNFVNSGEYDVYINILKDTIDLKKKDSDFSYEIILSEQKPIEITYSKLPKVNFFGEGEIYLDRTNKDQYDFYLREAVRLGLFDNTSLKLSYEDTYDTLKGRDVRRIDFMVAVGEILVYFGAQKRDIHVDYTPYRDWGEIPSLLKPFLSVYVVELGYGGDENKFLNPNKMLTRAEASTIIARLMSWQAKK